MQSVQQTHRVSKAGHKHKYHTHKRRTNWQQEQQYIRSEIYLAGCGKGSCQTEGWVEEDINIYKYHICLNLQLSVNKLKTKLRYNKNVFPIKEMYIML